MATQDQVVCICEVYDEREEVEGPYVQQRRPSALCPVHGDPRDTSLADAVQDLADKVEKTHGLIDRLRRDRPWLRW